MTIFYLNGFYDDRFSDVPESAVEISDELYLQLLDGQAAGKQIVASENGQPVLVEPKVDLAAAQAEMWERIKQKRHDNLRGGCFVKSVGKWFHTNDESRQQYIFMRTLPQLPAELMWKTMDNSFVAVTKALLDELSMQMLLDEQADFANAERHKAAMEREDNPLDYDYSTGWSETYAK